MKTYLDSGVLIAAFRADGALGRNALELLDDDTRRFICSEFVKLETLPKATYLQKSTEVAFYQTFFDSVESWSNDLDLIVKEARRVSGQYGLAAMDALHIAAALVAKSDEFVTTEKPTKPMFRVDEIRVVPLLSVVGR